MGNSFEGQKCILLNQISYDLSHRAHCPMQVQPGAVARPGCVPQEGTKDTVCQALAVSSELFLAANCFLGCYYGVIFHIWVLLSSTSIGL